MKTSELERVNALVNTVAAMKERFEKPETIWPATLARYVSETTNKRILQAIKDDAYISKEAALTELTELGVEYDVEPASHLS